MFFFHLFLSLTTRTLHQQFESYKEEVKRIGVENKRQQTIHKDDAPTCGICRKTKFANGCGHLCSYCQTKFCARCGGRVSLRSNNVRNSQIAPFFSLLPAITDSPHPPFPSFIHFHHLEQLCLIACPYAWLQCSPTCYICPFYSEHTHTHTRNR